MNQISRHISYLLLTCRKVEVPGLGTFFASYDNASFNTEFGIFYPSRIRINYEAKHSGSSLTLKESLRRRLKLKDSEAEKIIRDFVLNVGNQLKKNHYCRLEGIGYLIFNQGNLSFKDTFWRRNKFPILSPVHL